LQKLQLQQVNANNSLTKWKYHKVFSLSRPFHSLFAKNFEHVQLLQLAAIEFHAHMMMPDADDDDDDANAFLSLQLT